MTKMTRKVTYASILVLLTLLITALILPCVPAQAVVLVPINQQYWGMMVGIGKYPTWTYRYGADDAKALSNIITPAWGSDHVRTLTDTQATKSAIVSAFQWAATNAQANDTFLFYYSGYWDSTSWLGPYDYTSGIPTTWISPTELSTFMNQIKAGKIVIILDSWYTAPLRTAFSANGRIVLTAAGPSDYWWQDTAGQHGMFTKYLLQAFDKFAAADINSNFQLTAEELFNYASPLTINEIKSKDATKMGYPVLDDNTYGDVPLVARFTFDDNINLPSGATILTLDGTNYTAPPEARLWTPTGSHTMVVPETVAGPSGTQYVFTGWNDANTHASRTIAGGGNFIANYEKQYQLQIASAYGNPAGAGWYKDGSTATFSVESYLETQDTKHYLTGWSGDFTGTSNSAQIVMNGPKSVKALWRNEYLLTVDSSYGSPTGAGWYTESTTANFAVTNYVETADTKYYFTGWTGDFQGSGASGSVSMTGPKTVTANWRYEYLLKINSEYGAPTGAGWYKQGEIAHVTLDSVQGFLIRHIFNGWSGDASDIQSNTDVMMISPKTITANWKADYIQLIIVVVVVVVLAVGITVTLVLVRGKGGRPRTPPTYNPPPQQFNQPPPQPPTYNAPPPPPPPPPAR